jgi:hypothetical protein
MLSFTLWRALTTPVTYVLVAVLITTAILQVKYVNKALQRFDSTQVIPVQFVMFTLSVIIGSAILYRDFEKASAENVVKFIGGCLLTFFGVWLITSGRARNGGHDEEDESDEEDLPIDLATQDSAEAQYSDSPQRRPSVIKRASLHQNGDSANDGLPEDSRRLSHVSFADSTARPPVPRMRSTSSSQGPIRVVTSIPLSDEQLSNSEETPLLANPWTDSPNRPQAAQNPALLSETRTIVSGETSKPPNPRSSTYGNFNTHPNLQQGPVLPPPERPYTPTRHSMLGPLMSPLSGGLSVVIADSLRRGIESPVRTRPTRRSRLGLRRSKSGSQRLPNAGNESEEGLGTPTGSELDTSQEEFSKSLEPERGNWSGITRGRSLSNTLGELFRGKRQRIDRSGIDDEEAGPSGS